MTDVSDEPVIGAVQTDAAGGVEQPIATSVTAERARSLWSDAWDELRHKPLFWVSSALILLFVVMAAVPQLFTSDDPYFADLAKAREAPSADAWFGRDGQGYDVYARTIYGARASILVGVFATLFTLILGSVIGIITGYVGGWIDSVLSRISEIFLAIPLLQVKPNDYVQAARALGAGPGRVIMSHILPNSVASVIVVSTINLGAFIAVEATLSFLGIGLQPPAISWGLAISEASGIGFIRAAPHMLLFPSLFLSLTVLAFIMLGDVIRDALDPKLR
jgi:oligopeptide transport system permease protein